MEQGAGMTHEHRLARVRRRDGLVTWACATCGVRFVPEEYAATAEKAAEAAREDERKAIPAAVAEQFAPLRARVGVLTGALEYAVRYFGSGSFAMAGVGEAVEVMRAALGTPGGER